MKNRNYTRDEIADKLSDIINFDYHTFIAFFDEWIAYTSTDELIEFYEHLCRMWDL